VRSKTFPRDELSAAFEQFEVTVDRAAQTRDWDPWVEQYSPDVTYVEHAAGTMNGREEVRAWIWKTMETFPGSYMTSFPSLWSVIDESTGRIICELDNPMRDPGDGTIISATNISIITYAGDGQWCRQEDVYNSYMTSFPSLWSVIDESTGRIICELDNPMRDPGDGTIISATNISIITYAGDGQWCRQEDIYNPLRFVSATMKWCRRARELGTLPDEATAWMRHFGERK